MQLANSGRIFASRRHVQVSRGIHSGRTIGTSLAERHDGTRQLAPVSRVEVAIHPLQDCAGTIVTAVADERGSRHAAWIIAGRIKVSGESVCPAIQHDKADIGRVIEVGQLQIQLAHHIRPDCGVRRSNLHVNLAAGKVADRVNLISAPFFHVGGRESDVWYLVVHAVGVLSCVRKQDP